MSSKVMETSKEQIDEVKKMASQKNYYRYENCEDDSVGNVGTKNGWRNLAWGW